MTFKDQAGREWDVKVTAADVRRLKAAGTDLNNFTRSPAALGELVGDVDRAFGVLYALVRPQADAAGVTEEDLGAALGGDALGAALAALADALVAFIPDKGHRDRMRAAWALAADMQARANEASLAALAKFDVEAELGKLMADAEAGRQAK